MTGAHRPRRMDGNGVPTPVVKAYTLKNRPVAKCKTCLWTERNADQAIARLHVKTYPDHFVTIQQVTATEVFAETTDGEIWVEAVNAQ